MIEQPQDNNSGDQKPTPCSFNSISIISFNAQKTWETISTMLDKYAGYVDIVMFQEPAWRGVRSQPSTTNRMGDVAFGPPIHFSWKLYTELFDNRDKSRPGPRVLTYINKQLDIFRPQLHTDVIKHHDISLVTLYINHPHDTTPHKFNILNVYNDGYTHTALHELEQIIFIFFFFFGSMGFISKSTFWVVLTVPATLHVPVVNTAPCMLILSSTTDLHSTLQSYMYAKI
jgi:hypothetical protein